MTVDKVIAKIIWLTFFGPGWAHPVQYQKVQRFVSQRLLDLNFMSKFTALNMQTSYLKKTT